MSERTYTREVFLKAKASWDGFDSEWADIRRLAASRGFLFAPLGSAHDDREVESPSQRAIVYRALVDNPTNLRRIVNRSDSWFQVVDGIIGLEARLRADLADDERDIEFDRKERPSHRESAMSLKAVLQRLGDS